MFRTESLVPHRLLVDRSFSTVAFWQHVGILGTNKQIRQQALSMLRHNIQGTSDIMIAMDLKLPQDYLLGLIDQAILRPHFDVVDNHHGAVDTATKVSWLSTIRIREEL